MSNESLKGMDAERVKSLFQELDVDKDGRISVQELSKVLRGTHVDSTKQAEKVISQGDQNSDMTMDLAEFIKYIDAQEKNLRLAFFELDRNHDSNVDAEEIRSAMSDLGVQISLDEANTLLTKMDKDGSLKINFDEWRDFLLLTGTSNVKDIFGFLRRAYAIDIGDNGIIPDDFSSEEKSSGVVYKTLIAGGVAGAISRTSTAPLDRLKVIWQAQAGSKGSGKVSITGAIRNMIKEGGFSSLWRGNGVNVLKIAPESALKFLAYEKFKTLISGGKKDVSLAEKFAAGALAGATSQTIIYPMELLKTRMCLRKTGQYSSIFDCAFKAYKEGGLRVFYRGYVPNILGILPYAGIDLALYETFKRGYLSYRGKDGQAPPIYVSLVAGAISSVCGQVATYPLALVRTKMQASNIPIGLADMFSNIVKKEGPLALYRGMGPNFLKVVPAVSISYAVFEETSRLVGLKRN